MIHQFPKHNILTPNFYILCSQGYAGQFVFWKSYPLLNYTVIQEKHTSKNLLIRKGPLDKNRGYDCVRVNPYDGTLYR